MYTLGGVQKAVTEIINDMVNRDFDIMVLMPETDKQEKCFFLDDRIKVVDSNEVFSIRFGKIYKAFNVLNRRTAILDNPIGTLYSAKCFVKKNELDKLTAWINQKEFDAVVGVADKYALIVSLISKRIIAKTYGWMHSTFQGYYETRGQNLYGLKLLNKWNLKNLDAVLVLTHSDQMRFKEEMGVKCIVLYDPVVHVEKSIEAIKKYDFIFVGRMNRVVKGLDYLLEIMYKLAQNKPNFKLVVVGNGKDEKYFKNAVHKFRLDDQIEFVGFKYNVTDYYKQSKILLSTSRWEGFGMSIVEAMACGVPCVAFENDGPCEIISDGINGYLISKYETQQFADTLVDCLADQAKYEEMSTKAFKRSEDFSLDTIVAQFIGVLEGTE